jgi:hypothetical protein
MSEPVHIAAIDAGSNAVRLSVARAYSALDIEPLYSERYSLRLGESVFLRHRFTEDIFNKGVKAFRHFKEVMDEYGVTRHARGPQPQKVPPRDQAKMRHLSGSDQQRRRVPSGS